MIRPPPISTLFPHPTLFRSAWRRHPPHRTHHLRTRQLHAPGAPEHYGQRRPPKRAPPARSEEHTSEFQSRLHLVCRLLLEKKKTNASISILPEPRNTVRTTA